MAYAVSLRRSLLRALPTVDKDSEEQVLDHFIDGMPSSVATYLKLLRINDSAYGIRQSLNDNTSVAAIQTDTSIADLKTAVDALTEEVSAVRMTMKKPVKRNICYHCGQSGHWRRNCLKRPFCNHSNEHFRLLFVRKGRMRGRGDN